MNRESFIAALALLCTLLCMNQFFWGFTSITNVNKQKMATENAENIFPFISGFFGFLTGLWFIGTLLSGEKSHSIYLIGMMAFSSVLSLITMSLWAWYINIALPSSYQFYPTYILYTLTAATSFLGWAIVAFSTYLTRKDFEHFQPLQ